MKTNQTRDEELAQRTPGDLWLDDSVSPEELIRLDPCEETEDLLRIAGFFTFLDGFIAGLPEQEWTSRQEELWLKLLLTQGGGRETPESFLKRLRG